MDKPNKTPTTAVDVVVIDDEESIREGCRQTLESQGYHAAVVSDGTKGLDLVATAHPRIVLLDLRMPGISGIEVLEKLPRIDPRIVPIVITGYGTVDSAVSSMKLGAYDFIAKPFDPDQLLGAVARGLQRWESYAPIPPLKVQAPKAPAGTPRTEADVVLKSLEALDEFNRVGDPTATLTSQVRVLQEEADYHAKQLGQVTERKKALHDLISDLHLVDSIITRHQFKKNTLIQILLDLQAAKNWLPRHALLWISRRLNVPMARILEIATFYEAFSLVPQGRHTVQVCTGTACHVRHSTELGAMVSAVLGIKPGQTDPDLNFTLKEVHCLGCCALAPVVKVDDTYYGDPSLKQLKEIFAEAKAPAAKASAAKAASAEKEQVSHA